MTKSQSYSIFVPEIWSPRVSEFFKAHLPIRKWFGDECDYSDGVANGGDKVWIPKLSEAFTVVDIPTTSGDVTATNVNDTKTYLTIDTWKGASTYFSDFQIAQIMDNYRVQEKYADTIAYQLGKKFTTDLLDLTSNITDSVGDSATDLCSTSIEKALSILQSNSIPKEDCVMFMHPYAYWRELMKIQKYYDASQFGKPSVPQGFHDLLYGIPVVVSELVPAGTAGTEGGHRNFIVDRKNFFAYAFGNIGGSEINEFNVPVRIQEVRSSEALRTKLSGDIMYGKSYIRANAGVRIISKN